MKINRRDLLKRTAATTLIASASDVSGIGSAKAQSLDPRRPTLIKGGYIVSVDPSVGEIDGGDILIEDHKIAKIGKDLVVADAQIVSATGKLVLPGFIDTHRHTWETQLRSMIADGDFKVYQQVITGTGPIYRPEDVYAGTLLGSLGALNAGITTMLDWSHALNSPAHADSGIAALRESGIRGVFGHGDPSRLVMQKLAPNGDWRQPRDELLRIQKQYFSSDDQLLTLAMALRGPESSPLDVAIDDIKLARELRIRISMHVGVLDLAKVRAITKLHEAGMLGPDITHVHTLSCTDEELQMIADSGGTISTASAIELMSAHGYPSIQRWLKHGLRPSLSVDNETRMPGDLFSPIRALVMSDHGLEAQRVAKEGGSPIMVSMRDVLEFATIQGARATALDHKVGSLAPGKRADIIMIDLDNLNLTPVYDPVATAMMLAQQADISWVFVDGEVRKQDGKLVGVDIARVRGLAQASQAYLIETGKLKSPARHVNAG